MNMEFCLRERGTHAQADTSFLSAEQAEQAAAFHRTLPGYEVTPLVKLDNLAKRLGVGAVYLKDESKRFGLNAFKALGGSWAIAGYLKRELGLTGDVTLERLRAALADRAPITFITATDGNHGRGVAWTARVLGQRAVVYMPKGSAAERLENIRAQGAQAEIKEYNYDDTVRIAAADGEKHGWVLVQDTAWEGYVDIPTWIMQGYGTMGLEAHEQLPEKPTHIFLQAGVGSMAAAIAGLFAAIHGEARPIITIVEPNKADCIFRTAQANDGKLHFVTGDMDTIMAGLACGEPCSIGWEILRDYADHFISCPDYVAAKGMRILGNPAAGDDRVISGESGASCFGCVAEIMTNPELVWLREKLGLDENARVLFFSTEGDTDKENYRSIVWDGKYSSLT